MSRRLLGPALAVTATASLAIAALPTLSAQAAVPAGQALDLTTVVTGVPSWAHGAPDALEPGSARVDFVVQLATRNAAELEQVAASVSDPDSPDYQHFLTKAQYTARYAPTTESAHTVTALLKQAGLVVDNVSPQHTYLQVHGTAARVDAAFHTTLARFTVKGISQLAPLTPVLAPVALAGTVVNVAGLAQDAPLRPAASPAPVFLNARPCSDYYGQKTAKAQPTYEGKHEPYAICGYTGAQLRKAYALARTGLTGKGATVGIVDAYASPTILKDANTYATKHGDRAFKAAQFVENVPPGEKQVPEGPMSLLLDPQGWAGEQTLDVEAVHSMAPDAKVIYQSATSPYGPGLYAALAQIVEADTAQIVSNSYGTGSDSPLPSDQTLFDQITTTAAATGITVDFSSGDNGDETDPSATGERTGDFPATSTGVTAVGGTSLQISKTGYRMHETYWGTRKIPQKGNSWDFAHPIYSGAGGGGVSTTYAEPAWQKPVVPTFLTTYGGLSTPGRVEPDISMDADSTTGFLTGQTQLFADGSVKYSEYRIGGTSLSCPLFSGVLALAVGKRHKGLGLITPTLYGYAKTTKGLTNAFHDPAGVVKDQTLHQTKLANVRPDFTDPTNGSTKVTYSLRTLGNLSTLHRLRGYDDSTGLGSPRVPNLIRLLLR